LLDCYTILDYLALAIEDDHGSLSKILAQQGNRGRFNIHYLKIIMTTSQPHPDFERLSGHALLYTPTSASSTTAEPPRSHDFIIFCPWLGATPKHIAKYAVLLTRIAPNARILLLPSTLGTLFSPLFVVRKAMQPAVSVVQSILKSGGTGSDAARIFVYCFSNGGCFNLIRLLRALRATRGVPLAVDGMVLDSCPGQGTYAAGVRAMELSLPKAGGRLVRWPIMMIVRAAFAMLALLMRLGWKHPIGIMREELLKRQLLIGAATGNGGEFGNEKSPGRRERQLGGDSTGVRARYIFSKADGLVRWHDVQSHIDAARTCGWTVDKVLFEDSAHCAHYLKHPEAYEKALKEMWEGSRVEAGFNC
jgi:Eukaryotic protein of unknown function (DUF829)